MADSSGRHLKITRNGQYITSITDPIGRTFTYGYDGGHLTSVTDATQETIYPDTTPMSEATTHTRDNDGDLLSVTDPTKGTTKYAYNGELEEDPLTSEDAIEPSASPSSWWHSSWSDSSGTLRPASDARGGIEAVSRE